MSYQLESTTQLYGDNLYLAHNLRGTGRENDRFLFGQRVPSFGIISFGAMAAGRTKRITPADRGINSHIMLRSIYDFTTSATADEVTFKLFEGETEILEQRVFSSEMPYTFPPGAIIDPRYTIEVKPRYATTQLLIYWQPVHVLSLIRV